MSMKRVDNHYLADTARVTGDVTLGDDVSVWYGAVIRGDVAPITIGERVNVQDGVVVHCDHHDPNRIGRDVSIGHNAVVHGRRIGDGSLIGIGAVLLGRTVIGAGCLVAAGAVVPPGMQVPDGHVVMGVSGRVVRETTEQEKAYMAKLPGHYVRIAQQHVANPTSPCVFDPDDLVEGA